MAKKRKTDTATEKDVSFEQSLANLKKIILDLENGELTLDESLERYESGMKQLRLCYASLKSAEKRISQLVSIDRNGVAKTSSFDGEATFVPPSATDEFHAELQAELDEETSYSDVEDARRDDSQSSDMDDESSLF